MRRAAQPFKVIAYKLGIAESTARVLGARGTRKLGARKHTRALT